MKRSLLAAAFILSAASAMAQSAPAASTTPSSKPVAGVQAGAPTGAPGGIKATEGAPAGAVVAPGPQSFKPVTRAEAIKRATDQFDRMDRNKDGIVTGDEIEAMQKEMRAKFEEQQVKAGAPGAKPAGSDAKLVKPKPPAKADPASVAAPAPAPAK